MSAALVVPMLRFLRFLSHLLLLLSALCALGAMLLFLRQGQENHMIEQLQNQVYSSETGSEAPKERPNEPEADPENRFPASLKDKNADLAAWLTVPGTAIDYPVMLTVECPEFYLHRNFEKEYAYSGLPFADASCTPIDEVENLIVYGHNMRSGSMFSNLECYVEEDFFKENPSIVLILPEETRTYQIFAVVRLCLNQEIDRSLYSYAGALTQARYEEYCKLLLSHALYETGISPAYGDKLIALSTCSYHTPAGRLMVAGCIKK